MSLREKKKQETKKRIFEVSGRLFKEKGFENTTVDEITKEAGIAKGTFFNYFPTKESLLLYFKEQREDLIFNILESQIPAGAPAREKIKNLLVLLAESYEKDKEISRLLFLEYKKFIINSGQKPHEKGHRHQRLISILCDFLEDGVKSGQIKKEIDLKATSEVLSAIYVHSLMMWLHSDTDHSFSKDISVKIDILFEGIGE